MNGTLEEGGYLAKVGRHQKKNMCLEPEQSEQSRDMPSFDWWPDFLLVDHIFVLSSSGVLPHELALAADNLV